MISPLVNLHFASASGSARCHVMMCAAVVAAVLPSAVCWKKFARARVRLSRDPLSAQWHERTDARKLVRFVVALQCLCGELANQGISSLYSETLV